MVKPPPDLNMLDSAAHHRRQTLLLMALPVLGIQVGITVFILALVIPGSPLRFAERAQFSILGDTLMICLGLCPMAVCLFPACMLLVVSAAAVNKAHTGAARAMRRVHVTVDRVAEQTERLSEQVARKSIGFNVRVTFWNRLLNVFDRPDADRRMAKEEGGTDHDELE